MKRALPDDDDDDDDDEKYDNQFGGTTSKRLQLNGNSSATLSGLSPSKVASSSSPAPRRPTGILGNKRGSGLLSNAHYTSGVIRKTIESPAKTVPRPFRLPDDSSPLPKPRQEISIPSERTEKRSKNGRGIIAPRSRSTSRSRSPRASTPRTPRTPASSGSSRAVTPAQESLPSGEGSSLRAQATTIGSASSSLRSQQVTSRPRVLRRKPKEVNIFNHRARPAR